MNYTPPTLSQDDDKIARNKAHGLFRKYGMYNTVAIIILLVLENRKLFLEVNEHRAARGIDPLPEQEEWQ